MKILLFILSTTVSIALNAQTISGNVTDEDGNPMPGCNVYLDGTYFGTSTDVNGNFSFEASGTDSAIFKVEFLGYENFVQPVFLSDSNIELEVTLKEEFNKLNVVTVTAGMYGSGDVEEVTVLSSLDVVTTAGALGDVTGAMQTLPGTSTNGESGKLFVHGGSATETGTYIDGILVHQPYSSSAPNMAVRGRFNPFMFSGTAFSTGGYSAEYGQALSSVLVLNTNEMPVEESLNLSLMTVGVDAAGTKMWNNGAITASANYMNLKPYMTLIPQNYDWNKEPEAFGGAVNFRQKTKGNGMLKVYATADKSNLVQQQSILGVENAMQTIDLTNNNQFVNANWKGMLNAKWIVKGGGSYTHNVDAYDLDNSALTEKLVGSHAKLMAINEVNKQIHIRMGVEYFYKEFGQTFSSDFAPVDSTLNFKDNKLAAFAEAEIYTSKKFVMNLGARAEHSSYLNKTNISPRVSLAYLLSKNNHVSFAYGWFYQDPINTQMIGRPGLNYEKATHYIVSYNKEMEDRTLRAEVYYKAYDQLVKYPNLSSEFTNNGSGYAAGLDLYFRDDKTIKNGQYWISYSYLNSKRNYLDFPETARPSFANAHNISVVYKHWIGDWRSLVGATVSYGSPRPHNNPNNPQFMGDELKSYRSLDMNWSFLYRDNIIFFASVTNVLGFNNGYGYNYSPVPDNNGIYQRTEILPTAKRFFFIGCFITLSEKGTANQMDKIN